IFQELKQNWVVKVRLNIEFLQPRKLLKVSSNIWGSLHSGSFLGNPQSQPVRLSTLNVLPVAVISA
ncbi:hypothetical protein, partial [Latilactobacillus curvatus]